MPLKPFFPHVDSINLPKFSNSIYFHNTPIEAKGQYIYPSKSIWLDLKVWHFIVVKQAVENFKYFMLVSRTAGSGLDPAEKLKYDKVPFHDLFLVKY